MATYGKRSRANLETAHQDLQTIFNYVIKAYDNSVIYGIRTDKEQFELFKKGRKFNGESWAIEDLSKVVTYKDGLLKKSKHQPPEGSTVSMAVDAVPYYDTPPHIRWDDEIEFIRFGNFVLGVAHMLYEMGAIEHRLEWGGLWMGFKDYAHFQLVTR